MPELQHDRCAFRVHRLDDFTPARGLLIGLAEAFSIGYISSTFSQAIVFAILIAVMLVRPSGLLGRAAVQKV